MSQVVTIKRNTGNFLYEASFELSDAVVAAILERGCVSELQSGGAISSWEKAVAYPGKDAKRPKTNAAGEPWSRTDIPFTPETAEALRKAILGTEVKVGENDKGEAVKEDMGATMVNVIEYTGASAAEPKYKAEKEQIRAYLFEADGTTAKLLKSGEPRSIESLCSTRGLEAPTEPWDEDTTFLAAFKAWYKGWLASQD